MNKEALIIRPATVDDAINIIKHVKIVGDETDFLTFASIDFKKTIEEEKQVILDHNTTDNQLFFIAEFEGRIVGVSNFMASQKPRLRHIGEFGISVIKEFWGQGIGSDMINYLINWAKQGGVITKINLVVQKENVKAYQLYQRLGFQKEGEMRRAMFVKGEYYDAYYMGMLI